jgi:hypothetical protein
MEFRNWSSWKHRRRKPCKGKPTHLSTHGYTSWSTQPTQGDQSELMQQKVFNWQLQEVLYALFIIVPSIQLHSDKKTSSEALISYSSEVLVGCMCFTNASGKVVNRCRNVSKDRICSHQWVLGEEQNDLLISVARETSSIALHCNL